jgi:hypothetical protein
VSWAGLLKPCKLWAGRVGSSGYGYVDIDGVAHLVHRVVWEQHHGPLPAGFEVHHRCENTICIEWTHLVALTRPEHRAAHQLLVCARGHLLAGYNRKPNGLSAAGRPKITCRTCAVARERRRAIHPTKEQP